MQTAAANEWCTWRDAAKDDEDNNLRQDKSNRRWDELTQDKMSNGRVSRNYWAWLTRLDKKTRDVESESEDETQNHKVHRHRWSSPAQSRTQANSSRAPNDVDVDDSEMLQADVFALRPPLRMIYSQQQQQDDTTSTKNTDR